MHSTDNTRIRHLKPLASPALIQEEIPISADVQDLVTATRQEIIDILQGQGDRLLVVVGPCSIHDPAAAIEYAQKLLTVRQKHNKDLLIVMRVYFEKPRTTVGWKGLINDPNLDGSFHINQGLRVARKLLVDINSLGIPTGSEFLDTTVPQYISDLTSWAAIGARTTESQIHREMASGLSMPVGFKNGTTGNTQIAVDACYAASQPHHFLGVSRQGLASILTTEGNPACHVILRGANTGPNYQRDHVEQTISEIHQRQLPEKLMIDCSHGNSQKDYRKQAAVLDDIRQQLQAGHRDIFGIMLESNLVAGNQPLQYDTPLTRGQSITDACIDWQQTETLLDQLAETIQSRRQER